MRAICAALIAILPAGQAAALSCVKPDPVRTFLEIAAVETPYYILYGTLEFDINKQPGFVETAEPDPDPIPARFDGKGLTLEGFTAAFAGDVTLQPLCSGPWCGGAAPGVLALYFAAVVDGGLTIEADACGSKVFSEPTQDTLDAVTACMQGKPCEAAPEL